MSGEDIVCKMGVEKGDLDKSGLPAAAAYLPQHFVQL